ncbi:MAG: hypothetical protein LLG01_10195 [Planctomycetaceae bacterium]|nr:hypothetical protein [Planctomycetaceae bacterium]
MAQRTAIQSDCAVSTIVTGADGSTIICSSLSPSCRDRGDALGRIYAQAAGEVSARGLQVVHERLFTGPGPLADLTGRRHKAFKSCRISDDGPVTCILAKDAGRAPGGLQIRAVRASCGIEPVELEGRVTGRCWRQDGALWVILQNMHGLLAGAGADNSRSAQVQRMIQRVQQILAGRGGSYRDVVRTWIYIDEILDWYGPFNAARNAEYARMGIMPNGTPAPLRLPASTGIGGGNPFAAACMMDVLAIIPEPASRVEILRMTNVRQKEAFKYGSAFSRGVVIAGTSGSEIYISGTAAIDEQGKSLFPGDTARQIDKTLDVVEGLLGQAGASLADIAEASFFFKHAADAPLLVPALERRGLVSLPGVCVMADVCRDDLLFELDCMALSSS